MTSLRNFLENPENSDTLEKIGVYQIRNTFTGKSYIGSTLRSFRKRFIEHLEDLENKCHSAKYLQHSYNYNPVAFEFVILEAYDPGEIKLDRLIWREQCHINKRKPEFNSKEDADWRKPHNPFKWEVTSPDGKKTKVKNLTTFCREYKKETKETLNPTYLSDVAKGKKATYKGWGCTQLIN
jgi:group I intron endonuclease